MATKNLKYFMRPELKEEQIVEVPGPRTYYVPDQKAVTETY